MKTQRLYDEATDHLGILIDRAHEEQDKLTSARKVLDAEADAVRTEINMIRNVLGKESGFYGRGPIYPSRMYGKRVNPYSQMPPAELPPAKPMVFTEEDTAKMEERLADLENRQDKINAEQQENYKAFGALAGAIEDLSKARAFLTAPSAMFIRFYEDRNPDGSY